VILNNPHGKARSRNDPKTYIESLITDCKTKLAIPIEERRPFPKGAIRGLAKEFADLYSKYLESPWEFWAFSFLTCLGSILSPHLRLDSALRVEPRLFTILLAESAYGRKSECEKQTDALFSRTFKQDFHECAGVGSGEGLITQLNSYSNLLFTLDEFKTLFDKARIPASILISCVNTLFEDTRYESNTKNNSIRVDSAHLSILAASTIDTFKNIWTTAASDMGFLNRLWLVPARAERSIPIPQSIPYKAKKNIKKKLTSLVRKISKKRVTIPISPKAREIYNSWYMSVNTSNSDVTKRLDTYGLRLMLLFCANENKQEVTPEIAQRVVKLLEWQQQKREENRPIIALNQTAKLEQEICSRLRALGPSKRRDLQRKVHYERYGRKAWVKAEKNLQDAGDIIVKRKILSLKKMS
jgi:hypothetical protein